MDYEKMYKAVLKTATQWIEDGCSDKEKICLESIFPELRESEDERMLRTIIRGFECWKGNGNMTFNNTKVDDILAYLEKQKECVVDNNKTSAEEDERIRARLIEYFQGFLEGYEDCYKDGGCVKWEGLDVKSILAWLEKQKETANSFTDGIIEVRSFRRGMEEGRKLETQKEPGIKWLKSDNVKNPDKPYVDKAGMFYTTDGRMCYASEIEQQKEQKHPNGCFTCDEYKKGYEEGRRNGFTAGYNKAMKEVEQKEQKPVVTLGETYHVDTLGTQQVIAGKMPQKPAEWDDYTKTNLGRAIQIIKDARGTLHGYQTDDGIYECDKAIEALEHFLYRGLEIEKSAEWSEEDEKRFKRVLEIVDRHGTVPVFDGKVEKRFNAEYIWLKNLRERLKSFRPQSKQKQNDYITPHKEFFKFIYDRLINVHKENPNVDYMRSFKERINNLSFGEKQEWSEEDENKIESIKGLITMGKFVDTNTIKTIWKLLDSLRPQPKVEWSEEDEKMIDTIVSVLGQYIDYKAVSGIGSGYATPRYNKEIAWLKSLRPQPKQEWSEKECGRLFDIEHYLDGTLQLSPDRKIACIDFLKSLRPSWKPSEEQMEALEKTIRLANFGLEEDRRKALGTLYEQLKKLM